MPNTFQKTVTTFRSILQTGEGRHREAKWPSHDHAADSRQKSAFSDVQNTPSLKPFATVQFTTQPVGPQELHCAKDQLCSFVAVGRTYTSSHQPGCPQWRLPMRETFSNSSQTTSDNWQVLTTLFSRSSQNISLFYCHLQHLQDPTSVNINSTSQEPL